MLIKSEDSEHNINILTLSSDWANKYSLWKFSGVILLQFYCDITAVLQQSMIAVLF